MKIVLVEYVHTLYRSDLYGYSVKLVRDDKRPYRLEGEHPARP